MKIWIIKKSSLKLLLCSTIVFIIFMVLILPLVASFVDNAIGDFPSPDQSFFYTENDLYQMASDYGESGRETYIRLRFTFDLVFPIAYTFFMLSTIAFYLKNSANKQGEFLIYIPILAFVFDILENISASAVMALYPTKFPVIASATPIFSLFKWVFVNTGLVLALLALLLIIIRTLKKPQDR